MSGSGHRVLIGRGCRRARRSLDPTAWVVLEELVLAADTEAAGSTVLAPTSVRALASQLGLSKDTVASALRRLANAGIVRRQDERDAGSGRFGHSRYVVDLTSTGIGLAAPGQAPEPGASGAGVASSDQSGRVAAAGVAVRASRRPRRAGDGDEAQLSLLDPGSHLG